MQTKKRAKPAKFGAKAKPVEENKEEQKETPVVKEVPIVNEQPSAIVQPVEQNQQPQAPVKEEAVIKVENKEEKPAPEAVVNIVTTPVIEKNVDQASHEKAQMNDEAQVAVAQNQETVSESPAKALTEQESPVNDNAYIVQTEVKKNLVRYFLIIAIISFLIGLVSMAGINFFLQKTNFEIPFIPRKTVEITPSPKPTITIEPTKAAVVNLEEYSIEVLNGSGVTGAASKLKEALTAEGFKVISAGNADKSDYTDTIIAAKKKINSAYLEKLKENLKKTYTVVIDSKTSVPETSEADVVITIGSNMSQ